MTLNIGSRQAFLFVLVVFIAFFVGANLATDTTADRADGIWHYVFSRYCFQYPMHLLNLWAKPLFTALAAPFAQMGLQGVHFFQIVCTAVSCFLTYEIAVYYNLRAKALIPVFIFLAPCYYVLILSGMTEILFGMMIPLAVFLIVREKYILSCMVVSFIPFARQEGYMIILVFAVTLIFIRKYQYLPWLLVGIILYSLLGFIGFGDFLWLVHQHPYHQVGMYGHGEFLHYIYVHDQLFGWPFSLLLVGGLVVTSIYQCKNIKHLLPFSNSQSRADVIKVFLVYGIPVLFFVTHMYVWYKGMSGSLGLHRIMACIVPVITLIALDSLTVLFNSWNNKYFQWSISATLACVMMYTADLFHPLPMRLFGEEAVIKEICQWTIKNNYRNRTIVYSHPYTILELDFNPFDRENFREINFVPSKEFTSVVPAGSVIIWDGHFGPNEAGMPLSQLQDTAYYRELIHVSPPEPFTTLGGKNFEAFAFERK